VWAHGDICKKNIQKSFEELKKNRNFAAVILKTIFLP